MEEIDIFDEMYNEIEPYHTSIDNIHKLGLWHQTFACWLVNKNENIIYLQLRGPKNRIGANTFDASASGHLSTKEKPENGFRELEEELGSNIKIYDNEFLGVFRNIFISKNYINREFCNVFIANTDSDINDFTLQEGEVFGIYKLNIQDGIDLFSHKLDKATINGKVFDNNQFLNDTKTISINDFNLCDERTKISSYYLKVMIMAQRYINGISPNRI